MTDKFIRHLIAAIVTIVALVIYVAGYAMGARGWWFFGVAVFAVYFIVYTLVDV